MAMTSHDFTIKLMVFTTLTNSLSSAIHPFAHPFVQPSARRHINAWKEFLMKFLLILRELSEAINTAQ